MKVYITFDPQNVEDSIEITERKPGEDGLTFVEEEDDCLGIFRKSIVFDHNTYCVPVDGISEGCKKLYFLLYDENGDGESYHHEITLCLEEEKEGLYYEAGEFIEDQIKCRDRIDTESLDELMEELKKEGSVAFSGYEHGFISIFEKKIQPMTTTQTITLTAGEQSENHVGMFKQGGGLAEKGYDLDDLKRFKGIFDKLGCKTKICGLHLADPDLDLPEAYILLIRKGGEKLLGKKNIEKMFFEQAGLDWDKKYWDTRRGKVLNKHARHNLCYGEKSREPDYENKKGRIVGYDEIPLTKKYNEKILEIFGEKATELEGNFYYDLNKTGVGAHGDAERKIVIGLRLGATCPLKYCWYQNSEKITKPIKFDLDGGDMYVMSEKATGHDWKKKSLKTLRHCAGGEKYLKFP